MRISDHERQRALDELLEHLSAGRLGMDDYVERVGEVYSAETLADVDRARRDLPWMRIALPAGAKAAGARAALGAGGRAAPAALGARLVLVLSALLLCAGIALAVAAQVVWSALLVAGWVVGVAQGRAAARRR
ncbi:MAG TPA: DUF1707 domain-containing protein [Acidimicrobiales bacterium]|nr:DUF1707 domain-containing protein [Acidimicrobiales bacterium]